MAEVCPRCKKRTLRVVNVMGTTHTISLRCSECCYKEDRPYSKEDPALEGVDR
jgi:hypothetical protein